MKFNSRRQVNEAAGTRRCMSHAIFTPGQPGWMDQVERAIEELKPDSFKGYTIGDNTNKHMAQWPWRLDDEKLLYPFYERLLKSGHDIVCVHKGLFPPQIENRFPHLLPYARVDDLGKAAKDWPQIRFVIYHSPTASPAVARRSRAWRSSSAPAASNGPATSPRSPRSSAWPTSTATSARSSRKRRSFSPASPPP